MDPPFLLKAAVAFVPVIACIVAFERVDAFRLVRLLDIIALMAAGELLAGASFLANGGVLDRFPLGMDDYTRWIAPMVEETVKAGFIVLLFALNRIGYLIDAAIAGFAVGSGFALAENLFYLNQFPHADMGVWIVRGFGTAIMHGAATALISAISLMLYAPRLRLSVEKFHFNVLLFVPGLAAAIALHAIFNQFQHAALLAMAVMVVGAPLSLIAIFTVGEKYAHRWLAHDQQAHHHLLEDIRSGAFAKNPHGRAIEALARRLGPDRGKDLWSYLTTSVELVVLADDTLLAIEDHHRVKLDAHVREQLHHLHKLEHRLGRAPVMAVRQHLSFSRDDLWKLHELEADATRRDLKV
jgi:RsiW-degrading membrane proteinase PrsW (M82 family)